MNSSYQKFVKDNIIIGLANILVTVSRVFILLPLLTKRLGAYDYGIWSQVNITITLSLAFVGLGLPYAMTRFLSTKSDTKSIREEFYSILFFVFFITIVISSLIIVFSGFISKTFFQGETNIVKLTGFIILVWGLDWIYLSFFRTFRQMGRYFVFTIVQTFGEIGFIAFFVLKGHGIFGAVFSILIVRFILLIILIYMFKLNIGFGKPHFSKIKEYLSFGLPTIPANVSSWVISSSDRYIIGYFLGATSVGIYSVGYGLGHFPAMIITILGFVLLPSLSKLYDQGKLDDVKRYLSYSMKYFMALTIPLVFGACVLSQEILKILSTKEIASQAYIVVPLVAVSVLFYGFSCIIAHILVLTKKTKIIGIVWILSALINLSLNIFVIPYLGIFGAAITTFIAYLLAMVLMVYCSFKEFRFAIDWKFLLKSLTASTIMLLIVWKINQIKNPGIIFIILIGIIIYGAVLFILKGFEKKEINFFRGIIGYNSPNM